MEGIENCDPATMDWSTVPTDTVIALMETGMPNAIEEWERRKRRAEGHP